MRSFDCQIDLVARRIRDLLLNADVDYGRIARAHLVHDLMRNGFCETLGFD